MITSFSQGQVPSFSCYGSLLRAALLAGDHGIGNRKNPSIKNLFASACHVIAAKERHYSEHWQNKPGSPALPRLKA